MAGYRRGLRLPGSVVVVTGAAGGIGRATALALAEQGARPVLIGGPGDAVDEVAAACGPGASAPAWTVDGTDPDAVRAAAERTVARCGRLDGWVQCAEAADTTTSGALVDLPPAQVRGALDVAVLGAVHGARATIPAMLAGGGGVFVVVASVHGQVALPGGAPQSMAAAALRAMAGALRQELRTGGRRRGRAGVAVTTVLAPAARPVPVVRPAPPSRVAATVLRALRRPRLEKVAAGPLEKALFHGHALVPGATEWWVARRASAAPRSRPAEAQVSGAVSGG